MPSMLRLQRPPSSEGMVRNRQHMKIYCLEREKRCAECSRRDDNPLFRLLMLAELLVLFRFTQHI